MSTTSNFKRFLKWGLVAIPIGSLAYINRHFYFGNMYKVHKFDETDLSETSKKYVEQNNLVSPHTFQNYVKKYDHDHFFEKSILNQMNGLNEYNIFLDKNYYQVITDEVEASKEEKQKAHHAAKLHCIFTANSRVQGHLGIVHGGFTSTLFDNLAGSLAFLVADYKPAVTAYLNVAYKKPLKIGKEYIGVVEVDKIEDRKIFLKGKIVDNANIIYTTFDSLFIKTQMDGFLSTELEKKLQDDKQTHDEQHNLAHANKKN